MNNFAYLSERSSRYPEWIKVFGTNQVPILNTLAPNLANVLGEIKMVYLLDLSKLSEQQMTRLKEHIVQKFGVSMEEVERTLPEIGVPILAEDVTVSTDEMFFL